MIMVFVKVSIIDLLNSINNKIIIIYKGNNGFILSIRLIKTIDNILFL